MASSLQSGCMTHWVNYLHESMQDSFPLVQQKCVYGRTSAHRQEWPTWPNQGTESKSLQ